MLKICIANLNKYNKGLLVNKWIKLPVTNEELDNVLKEIDINENDDGYFIFDYESDIDHLEVGAYDNIYNLNVIAATIENMDDSEREIYSALLHDGYNSIEAIDKIDDCIIYFGCYTMEAVAEKYVEDTGILDQIPENLQYYFDYAAYGRDMEIEGHFIKTDSGYVQIL